MPRLLTTAKINQLKSKVNRIKKAYSNNQDVYAEAMLDDLILDLTYLPKEPQNDWK